MNPSRFEICDKRRGDPLQYGRDQHRFSFHHEFAGLEPRKAQQILNEVRELELVPLDAFEVLLLRIAEGAT